MKLFTNTKFINIYRVIKYIYLFILFIFILFLILKSISKDILGYRLYSIDFNNGNYKYGDISIIKNVSLKTISIGDYILIRDGSDIKNDEFIIGRIKDINYDVSNKVSDVNVLSNNKVINISNKRIIGKIIGIIPFISLLNRLFINKISFIFVYVIPIIFIIFIDYMIRYYKLKKEEIDVI